MFVCCTKISPVLNLIYSGQLLFSYRTQLSKYKTSPWLVSDINKLCWTFKVILNGHLQSQSFGQVAEESACDIFQTNAIDYCLKIALTS